MPARYFVAYLPIEREERMIADYGDSWMDHDPEWHLIDRDFATLVAARKFVASGACSGTFVEINERKNIRTHEAGPMYGYEWDSVPVEEP